MLVNLNLSNNVDVNIAEDIRGSDTAAAVSVTTTASVALLANPLRGAYSIYNVGPQTVFVRENSTVTAAIYKHPIPVGYLFESDFSTSRYTGPVAVITTTGTSSIMVTESVIAA